MIYKLATLAALLDVASAHQCAVEGAKHCWESAPVSGNPINHLVLNPHHHVDIDHHHHNSRVDREHDDDKSEGYLDEEYSEGHRGDFFNDVCAVSHSRNWNWFHFEIQTRRGRGAAETETAEGKRPNLRFKIDHDGLYLGDLEVAVVGPFDSLDQMQHDCGILSDEKIKTCSTWDGSSNNAPNKAFKCARGKYGGGAEGNDCREVVVQNPKQGEIYALLVGSKYEDSRLSINLMSDLRGPGLKALRADGTTIGCVECDQFWDGASIENLGEPVCMKRSAASASMFPSNFQPYWEKDEKTGDIIVDNRIYGHQMGLIQRIWSENAVPLGGFPSDMSKDPRLLPFGTPNWRGPDIGLMDNHPGLRPATRDFGYNGPAGPGGPNGALDPRYFGTDNGFDEFHKPFGRNTVRGTDLYHQPLGPIQRKLTEGDVDEDDDGAYYPDWPLEYWVHECRPADLSGLPPSSSHFDRHHPFEHRSPSKMDDVDEEHPPPYVAGIQNVFDLERVLKAVHKPACPNDHWLVLADHHEDPLPDCACDSFPDAKGDLEYLHDMHGKTMCMKIEVLRMPRAGDQLNLVCHAPHPDYPHVGVEDGGHRTWEGCRSDQVACSFRGLRQPGYARK